jgi:hypothetical protein
MRSNRNRRFFLDGSGQSLEMAVCGRERFLEDETEESDDVVAIEELEAFRQAFLTGNVKVNWTLGMA